MRIRRDEEDEGVEVPMTPMIDCVFLLLIFFLVTASLRKPHKELPIELPHAAASAVAKAPKRELVISLDREGRLFLDNQANITTEELHRRLQQVASEAPETRIRIDADRQARVQQLAQVADLCQLYGLNRVGIRTRD